MKIAVDEHIPLMTVRALLDLGHDVRDIRGTADESMQDDALWEMVQREERLLITTDKGFTRYRTTHHRGILIVRLRKPNRHRIHHGYASPTLRTALAPSWKGERASSRRGQQVGSRTPLLFR